MDFMSRSAHDTVLPMPGMEMPAIGGGQNSFSGSGPSEKLTMDTKSIPAAPMPEWKTWNSRAKELVSKSKNQGQKKNKQPTKMHETHRVTSKRHQSSTK